jgi:hypothetical protein
LQTERATAAAEAVAKAETAAQTELHKVWGEPGTETHSKNVSMADRAIRTFGGEALLTELKSHGLLSAEGAPRSPMLAQALAKIGAMTTNDQLVTGQPGQTSNWASMTFAEKRAYQATLKTGAA